MVLRTVKGEEWEGCISGVRMMIGLAFSCLLAFTPPTMAQEGTEADVSVDLGWEVAVQGTEARLPLILSARNSPVLLTINRISFPYSSFSFQRAEVGSRVDKDAVELVAEVHPAADGSEDAMLEVRIKSRSQTPLPNAVLALLVFKISEEASAGDFIFKNSARILNGKSQEIVAKGKNGTVTILDQPPVVIACFFYMH